MANIDSCIRDLFQILAPDLLFPRDISSIYVKLTHVAMLKRITFYHEILASVVQGRVTIRLVITMHSSCICFYLRCTCLLLMSCNVQSVSAAMSSCVQGFSGCVPRASCIMGRFRSLLSAGVYVWQKSMSLSVSVSCQFDAA